MSNEKRIVVLHGRVSADADPDEQDVLVEVRQVSGALDALGYEPVALALTLDLEAAARRLSELSPLAVFNLVESVEGRDRLLHLATTLLDCLKIPYTGTGSDGMYLASNKLLAKRLLSGSGIPTPEWTCAEKALAEGLEFDPPCLVKSVWDNGSQGLGEIFESREELQNHLDAIASSDLGTDVFVESYIEGREFNLSLLESGSDCEVLPPAEMLFVDYPPGKPRVVGYAAKWHPSSFEYRHTVRRFDFQAEDRQLLDDLTVLARRCWRELGIAGYARVDFRVDLRGAPWVLEVNPNPCLSRDAGLAAAAARAGLSYRKLVKRILRPALRRAAGRSGTLANGRFPDRRIPDGNSPDGRLPCLSVTDGRRLSPASNGERTT
jgi:D-alanine-D-alanine ligase